jgi:mono/diheme cytochrome c family protein
MLPKNCLCLSLFLACGSSVSLLANLASAQETPAALFEGLCAVCHGAAGLHPKPANFTDCRAMAKDTDQTLLKIIKDGGQSVGRSTVMPSWKDSLNDGQILSLVKYVRDFCKK